MKTIILISLMAISISSSAESCVRMVASGNATALDKATAEQDASSEARVKLSNRCHYDLLRSVYTWVDSCNVSGTNTWKCKAISRGLCCRD